MPLSLLGRLTRPFTTTAAATAMSATDSSAATAPTTPETAKKATVAAGCFWGVEHMYRTHFQDKGLINARVGYIGGDLQDPSYRAVCGGDTGHAEALQIVFNPKDVSYRELLLFFYRMHDPTTANRQGPDTGPQYRSAIFFHDDEQEAQAREITKLVSEQWYGGKVVTQLIDAGKDSRLKWWDAEQYHQLYLSKNPSGYECPSHFLRTFPKLEGLKDE